MKLTIEQISAARDAAHKWTTGPAHFMHKAYVVNYALVNPDKRKGRIHSWTKEGVYIGQFKTHGIALERGAAVTQHAGVWFLFVSLDGVVVPETKA